MIIYKCISCLIKMEWNMYDMLSFKLTLYVLYWTLTPKCVTRILLNFKTKHISEKACHEDAKYQISFILNYYLKEAEAPGVKFLIRSHYNLIKIPMLISYVDFTFDFNQIEHTNEVHWPNYHTYQVWSNSDENCRRSSLFSEMLTTTDEVGSV